MKKLSFVMASQKWPRRIKYILEEGRKEYGNGQSRKKKYTRRW